MRCLVNVVAGFAVPAVLVAACGGVAALDEASPITSDAAVSSDVLSSMDQGIDRASIEASVMDHSAGFDAVEADAIADTPGDAADEDSPVPVDAAKGCVSAIVAGNSVACAIRHDGTLWCWGENRYGQLGDGTHGGDSCLNAVCKPTPVQVIAMGHDVVQVAVGGGTTCALRGNGAVWCWGLTEKLGDEQLVGEKCWGYASGGPPGPTQWILCNPSPTPFKGFESGVLHVAMGWLSACAVKADGTLWCWGGNSTGQLGDGTIGDPACSPDHPHCDRLPVQAATTGTIQGASVGQLHACSRTQQGTVRCWGDNLWAQLGRGNITGVPCGSDVCEPLPGEVAVPGDQAAELSVGDSHTCGRKSDGTVWCWGDNSAGQTGDGTTEGEPCGYNDAGKCRATPVQTLGIASATSVSAGSDHTCAIRSDKTLWCWGSNSSGQLGTGTVGGSEPIAVQVSSLGPHVVSASAGANFTCAVTDDGSAWCWGNNIRGALGNGVINGGEPCGTFGGCEPKPVPVALSCP